MNSANKKLERPTVTIFRGLLRLNRTKYKALQQIKKTTALMKVVGVWTEKQGLYDHLTAGEVYVGIANSVVENA